jgi:hypothetical protein
MSRVLRVVIAVVRRAVGLVLLAIGILGILLPILPGWPFIIPAVVLLGRRDRVLRMTHLIVRHALRRLRWAKHPTVRKVGVRLSAEYVKTRRMVVPAIDATERAFARAWFA